LLPKTLPAFAGPNASGQYWAAPELVFNWAMAMRHTMHCVCLVEAQDTSVTGFLVGPDLVLCASRIAAPSADWRSVRAKFDHHHTPAGTLASPTIYPVVEAVTSSDDYTLLRLDGTPGANLVPEEQVQRGWLTLSPARPSPGQGLFMLHHGLAGPQVLELASARAKTPDIPVEKLTAQDISLVAFSDVMAPGSAGAPICNEAGQVVAMRTGKGGAELLAIWARDLLEDPAFAAALKAAAAGAGSVPEAKAERLRRTRDNLKESFNLEELEMFASDIDIPWEELTGETRTARVFSLVEYADRRGLLDKLLLYAAELRPYVKWM
jgi:hypothetical protein